MTENLAAEPTDVPPEGGTTNPQRFNVAQRYPWAVFVLPLVVYLGLGQFEPAAQRPAEAAHPTSADLGDELDPFADDPRGSEPLAAESSETRPARRWGMAYPAFYSARVAATIVVMLIFFPGYMQFPLRISWLAAAAGMVGVVLWVGICSLHLEARILAALGFDAQSLLGVRAGMNPFDYFAGRPVEMAGFLVVRFLGLALVVPIIEEFFLRGFLMRFVIDPDTWWKLPFGVATTGAIAAGTLYGMLTHPGELLAAAVWFSLITWLMLRTKSIWDCATAHAVTNFLLGLWVLLAGDWKLW